MLNLRIKKYYGVYEIVLMLGRRILFRQELVMDTDGEYIVDMKTLRQPQKRTNKTMDGNQLLAKAMKGNKAFKTEKQLKKEELEGILKGNK